MKYLINRKTKEHKVLNDDMVWRHDDWQLVGADSEGWIKHTGTECPLPDDVRCEYIMRSHGKSITVKGSGILDWSQGNEVYHITHYRPILEQAEPTPAPQYDPRSVSFNLLKQLAAAHEAAAKIPDIIAQIKTMLEKYGHTVVPMNPFVAAEFVEPEAAVDPTQDMADWRNWRAGDVLTDEYIQQRHGAGE
jgi:hypothetical protein